MHKPAAIAIVGIGGLFPDAPDLEQFWKLIRDGKTAVREVPAGRWQVTPAEIFDPQIGKADHLYSTKGCFIEHCPQLPELADLDPLFHLLVSAGKQAFDDACTNNLDRSRIGVIIGNLALPTETASRLSHALLGNSFAQQVTATQQSTTIPSPKNRFVAGLPAGILAQFLGLGGVTSTLDAACASSLYAIKLAIDELLSHRSDAMLCGGVSRPDPLYTQVGFSQLRALSKRGICTPFDTKGDGLVVGEGAGIFLLKRLEDAVTAGDHIYGVIQAVGISNDVGGSLLAPSSDGQLRAMVAAYRSAGWQPEDVDLIECHATGTPVGDAVEFASLTRLWQRQNSNTEKCVIGSVKSNIGHLLTAAGAAALTKVLLAMTNETLPPTAGFENPQPAMKLENSPFQILKTAKPWQRRSDGVPRRAAVSAFGFGGINAHLLLEEWLPEQSRSVSGKTSSHDDHEPIAIVGLDATFGSWHGLAAIQERLFGGKAVKPAPPTNWYGLQDHNQLKQTPFADQAVEGWFIDQVSSTKNRFRIPPKELEEMLPQQLLMLQTAANALADAGQTTADPLLSGVFIGIALDLHSTDFCLRWDMPQKARQWAAQLGLKLTENQLADWVEQLRDAIAPPLTANRTMGALGNIVASRIAREFRFGGPAFTMSAEENSGIRALETAVRLLQQKELNQAVVGAVELTGDPRAAIGYQALPPYGIETDKILLGEGACAFVLKRLADAKRDGNRIYAVVQEIGTSRDDAAKKGCITAGNLAGKEAAFTQSYPYFNAAGLLGHSGAASGLASVMAATISLYQQVIPPQAVYQTTQDDSEQIPLSDKPHYWLRNRAEGSRKAGVQVTSVDGSCSHLLLKEYDNGQQFADKHHPLTRSKEQLFPITANSALLLQEQLDLLQSRCQSVTEKTFCALAAGYRQQYSPDALFGLVLVATDKEQLFALLPHAKRAITLGDVPKDLPPAYRERLFFTSRPLAKQGKIAFVFPGSGSHYSGMGQQLLCRWPAILRKQDQENLRLKDQFQPQLFWNPLANKKLMDNQQAVIFGQVAIGCAMTDLVQQFGIRPDAMLGYSLGETAALFASHAWHERDLMLAKMESSTLFTADLAGECRAAHTTWQLGEDETVNWGIGLLTAPTAEVQQTIAAMRKNWQESGSPGSKPLAERLYLLITNCNNECVAGGDAAALAELVRRLGCSFFPLQGVTTVHCEVAKTVAKPYRKLHLFATNTPAGIEFYSCATKAAYRPNSESAADAIVNQALQSIDYQATVEAAWQDGIRIFLEMGPGNSCSRMINRILEDRPHLARSVCFDGQEPDLILCRFLAALIAERVPVDLSAFDAADCAVTTDTVGELLTLKIGATAWQVPKLPKVTDHPLTADKKHLDVKVAKNRSKPITEENQQELDLITNRFLEQFSRSRTAEHNAHDAFLTLQNSISLAMAEAIARQAKLCQQIDLSALDNCQTVQQEATSTPSVTKEQKPANLPCLFDRDMCMEFAIGSVGKMLGPRFAEVDSYPTRVRLPDEPLMLVDRIISLEGEPCSMTSGRVVTEHDILPGAWYLDGGRIPTCIAVESGQADLFLAGYLGADFITKGLAVYRLLDAVVTFHRPLPAPSQTIRYDIRIDHFFRQGDTWLFSFNFDATVDGQPMLTMRDGCAGFFSAVELQAGKGIVRPAVDLRPVNGIRNPQWQELVPFENKEKYNAEQLDRLRVGDLASCFGTYFANLPINKPLTIPGDKMRLVHRVLEADPTGGRYGLGLIRAEADIHADDWFITCHFVDDRVMPGTLMYECCMHTLRIMLLRMGWVVEADENAVWEPVPGVASRLRCRGQVLETTNIAGYEVAIREIGYNPEPYVLADAMMYSDGKAIVEITNMSCRLSGGSKQKLEELWQRQTGTTTRQEEGNAPFCLQPDPNLANGAKPALYDKQQIFAFSNGNPSEAFGELYKPFDRQRKIARLPGPPFQFLDRVTAVQGEPWLMQAGAMVETVFDLPADAWFFAADRQPLMPFCILLEIALQPCGWLAAYVGSALTSEQDLSFRNLGGKATQYRTISPQTGSLTCTAKLTKAVSSGGMIIQEYDFTVSDQQGLLYSGETMFGFFSADALANQVGIRDALIHQPDAEELARGSSLPYPVQSPFPDVMLQMIDQIDLYVADGGPTGLGFIKGSKQVKANEWFFDAHFYQDPVTPGSLGLESFLQLLRFVALKRWGKDNGNNLFRLATDYQHHWLYRGQIVPTNKQVTVTAWIIAVDDEKRQLTANGYLAVDDKIIYQMNGFTIQSGE